MILLHAKISIFCKLFISLRQIFKLFFALEKHTFSPREGTILPHLSIEETQHSKTRGIST